MGTKYRSFTLDYGIVRYLTTAQQRMTELMDILCNCIIS